MTNHIYPDKTKTGLAALKPLTDVFFAEPERWEWEVKVVTEFKNEWTRYDFFGAMQLHGSGHNWDIRLTPKPRRVWIGDQSFPEPVSGTVCLKHYYVVDVLSGCIRYDQNDSISQTWVANGFVFNSEQDAKQCLDAYRRARRVE